MTSAPPEKRPAVAPAAELTAGDSVAAKLECLSGAEICQLPQFVTVRAACGAVCRVLQFWLTIFIFSKGSRSTRPSAAAAAAPAALIFDGSLHGAWGDASWWTTSVWSEGATVSRTPFNSEK